MEAHKIKCITWSMLLALQLTGKAQQAYAALSSEHSRNFTKVEEAIFSKHYDIIMKPKRIARDFSQL